MERERLDCAVYALSVAAQRDYAEVLAWSRDAGRRKNCRIFTAQMARLLTIARANAVPLHEMSIRRRTIGRFAREWSTGRFLVRVGGHFVAVLDGVIEDGTRPTKIVTHAYRIGRAGI